MQSQPEVEQIDFARRSSSQLRCAVTGWVASPEYCRNILKNEYLQEEAGVILILITFEIEALRSSVVRRITSEVAGEDTIGEAAILFSFCQISYILYKKYHVNMIYLP